MPRDTPAQSLTQAVYERLRADLLTCRLRPGEKLKINELCQALGVSLGAVREALSRLTSEGFVTAEPQRGFCVAPISADELRDLTDVRIEIETRCLRRSIERGGIEWETSVLSAHHVMTRLPFREPSDPTRVNEAWAQAHAAFHRSLVDGCGSAWLLRLRELLFAQSERYRRLSVPLAREARDLDREHREIMEAAVAHETERAVALLTAHVRMTSTILLEAGAREALGG